MKWYAIFVKTGKEEEVKRQIRLKLGNIHYKCCTPKRMVPEKKKGKISHVVKMMFPGYVFVQTKIDFVLYHKIVAIPDILSLLNYSNKKDIAFNHSNQDEEDFFKDIPDEEMTKILELINPENDTMVYSKFWLNKEKLTILSGPLVGKEGRIKKIDKHKLRAKLAIHFMGNEKLIDIGFDVLNLMADDCENETRLKESSIAYV